MNFYFAGLLTESQDGSGSLSGGDHMRMTSQPGRMHSPHVQEEYDGRIILPYANNGARRDLYTLPPLRTDFAGGSLSSQAQMGGAGSEYGRSGWGQQP